MIETVRGRVSRLRSGYLARPYTSLQLLLLAGAMLLTFGILMSVSTTISAATSNDGHGTVWTQMNNEVLFIALGVPMLWLGARIPPRVYRMLVYPVLLLAAIMLSPSSRRTSASSSTMRTAGSSSDRCRSSPASSPSSRCSCGRPICSRAGTKPVTSPARGRILWPVLPGFVIVSALVMAEPDLGTTLCFLTILMGLFWTIGLPLRYFAAVLAFLVAMVTVVAVLDPRRLERLTSFMHPLKDTSNTGHQALQGLYALSSGGIFGVGLGAGPLKFGFVPNASSDYVFAIIGEELGLLGCLVVLAAFGLFAYAALRVARRSEDCFVRLAASGTAVWICGQALINIGYVTGLLPVTGIPLPFVSAGGTSLVLTMGVLGMLVSFARHEPEAVAAARADAAAGERSGFARWTRLGVPRVAEPAKVRPAKVRPAKARPRKVHPAKARPANARVGQAPRTTARPARAARPTAAQPRPASSGSVPARTAQPRAAQPQAAQPRAAQPQAARPRAAQPQAAQPRAAQPRVAQPRVAQPRMAQAGSAQPQSGQPRTARTAQRATAIGSAASVSPAWVSPAGIPRDAAHRRAGRGAATPACTRSAAGSGAAADRRLEFGAPDEDDPMETGRIDTVRIDTGRIDTVRTGR